MHKPPAVLVYSGIGLASFGLAYDSGLLGATDGHDHSAVFAVATTSSTGTTAFISAGTYAVMNNIVGNSVVAPLPIWKPSQQQT